MRIALPMARRETRKATVVVPKPVAVSRGLGGSAELDPIPRSLAWQMGCGHVGPNWRRCRRSVPLSLKRGLGLTLKWRKAGPSGREDKARHKSA